MDGCFICRLKATYPNKGGRNESGIDFLIQDSARKWRRIFHKMSNCSPKKWHWSHSKKWLKHIPPCTRLITVQIMPATIWTQSNLISCNFLPFQLCTHSTLTSQPLLMPNWIFAANGLLSLLAPPRHSDMPRCSVTDKYRLWPFFFFKGVGDYDFWNSCWVL